MISHAPVVMVLGPSRAAVSGVSTHLNLLFGSSLARDFALVHFQVGSEGRGEGAIGRLLRLTASPFALAARILAEDAAIVHLNTSLNARAFWRDLAYLLAAKVCGARVIYQVHGGALPRRFARGSRPLEALLRAVLRLPDAVVVLAQSEMAAYRQFLPAQLVVALPNGIDVAPYAAPEDAAPAPAAALRLIYVGRLARDKGLFELLRGLAQARAQGVPAELTMAGSGPDAAPLAALAEQLGLDGAVRFVGPVFGTAKLALYAAADALALPTHAEGMPYALLESMASGVPAITTRVGGIPDVVTDGVHGLFVPPGDAQAIAAAISTLAADRALLANMRRACRRRIVHGFSLDRLAGDFRRLYWAVCAGRRADSLGKP